MDDRRRRGTIGTDFADGMPNLMEFWPVIDGKRSWQFPDNVAGSL